MTPPNVSLLKLTLTHIETHPGEWGQGIWRRKTERGFVYDFASWSVVLSGGRWLAPAVEDPRADDDSFIVAADQTRPAEHVEERARALLGLTVTQADRLFWGLNDLSDLRRIVAEICDQAARDAGVEDLTGGEPR